MQREKVKWKKTENRHGGDNVGRKAVAAAVDVVRRRRARSAACTAPAVVAVRGTASKVVADPGAKEMAGTAAALLRSSICHRSRRLGSCRRRQR